MPCMHERNGYSSIQKLGERIERGTESKRTVEQLISEGTENTYDWLTTLEVMSIGAAAALKSGKAREAGLKVLHGVDKWLADAPFGIVYKNGRS
jgi:hypothetical protein